MAVILKQDNLKNLNQAVEPMITFCSFIKIHPVL